MGLVLPAYKNISDVSSSPRRRERYRDNRFALESSDGLFDGLPYAVTSVNCLRSVS